MKYKGTVTKCSPILYAINFIMGSIFSLSWWGQNCGSLNDARALCIQEGRYSYLKPHCLIWFEHEMGCYKLQDK